MFGRERLAVMMCGKQHFLSVEIRQRKVGGESLLGMDQHVSRARLEFHVPQHLAKCYTLPLIVKAAPAGHAVEVASTLHSGKTIELLPCPAQRLFQLAIDAELPGVWIEMRDRTVVERSEEHTSELQSRGHLVCRL